MKERFIGQSIQAVPETLNTVRMAAGEPGCPAAFRWGAETLRWTRLIRTWRETGPCRHGSGERYVRKHWYEFDDGQGRILKIYFARQPRQRDRKDRWCLFSITDM